MKITLVALIYLVVFSKASLAQNFASDSTEILAASNKFYELVFSESLGPLERWENKKLKIDTDSYYEKLNQLGIISQNFIDEEELKFSLCYKASERISYEEILDCGCSIVMLLRSKDCEFFHYIYWMFTQERFQGFTVDKIEVENDNATSKINFYYTDGSTKYFDTRLNVTMYFHRYDDKWLIDSIKND